MAEKRPLVNYAGSIQELTVGDTLPSAIISPRREVLVAARAYYVATTGSDSNDGLAAGAPFLTLQKAIDVVAAIDLSIYDVTIQLADGTYGAGCLVKAPWVGAGTVTVQGNATTPTSVVLSTGAADVITVQDSGRLTVKDFKITNTGLFGLYAQRAGSIIFSGVDVGAIGKQQIRVSDLGVITASGNYTISGGADMHYSTAFSGVIRVQSKTITISGTPAFVSAFANITSLSSAVLNGNTYSGAATGKRYDISSNSFCLSGGVATYFPGDVAGTTSTGGLYL